MRPPTAPTPGHGGARSRIDHPGIRAAPRADRRGEAGQYRYAGQAHQHRITQGRVAVR
ncbi:hypothetical protein ACFVW1_31100 [Streptomyces olivochromogenes]|uniref:hypothetical protein n=1 Tax=Streptomyces olivochromogenes TaxID=1963 RepID=UPI0036DE85E3